MLGLGSSYVMFLCCAYLQLLWVRLVGFWFELISCEVYLLATLPCRFGAWLLLSFALRLMGGVTLLRVCLGGGFVGLLCG